jgi:hypothetical protein
MISCGNFMSFLNKIFFIFIIWLLRFISIISLISVSISFQFKPVLILSSFIFLSFTFYQPFKNTFYIPYSIFLYIASMYTLVTKLYGIESISNLNYIILSLIISLITLFLIVYNKSKFTKVDTSILLLSINLLLVSIITSMYFFKLNFFAGLLYFITELIIFYLFYGITRHLKQSYQLLLFLIMATISSSIMLT